MNKEGVNWQNYYCVPLDDEEALRHLKGTMMSGSHWYLALLQAIGLWAKAEEVHQGRLYRYLIAGEAFDWLLLAERLLETVDGLLPEAEKVALLFHGRPPFHLPAEKFQEIIGSSKYHQYLNYYYGVTVEEALLLSVQEEVRKERWARGFLSEADTRDDAYQRIYRDTQSGLMRRFRQENGYPQLRSIDLTRLREFTYWLFKYRLKECDKARVASDTRKALSWLGRSTQRAPAYLLTGMEPE